MNCYYLDIKRIVLYKNVNFKKLVLCDKLRVLNVSNVQIDSCLMSKRTNMLMEFSVSSSCMGILTAQSIKTSFSRCLSGHDQNSKCNINLNLAKISSKLSEHRSLHARKMPQFG